MNRRPNVVFFVSDQHTHKCVGSYGHPVVKTPNLDRLAGEGTRFTHAVCQSPICTPSRLSFLSGQYCHNHGYYGLCGPQAAGLPSVLSHFRNAGYATGAFGKTHCPEYWLEGHCDVFQDPGGAHAGGTCADYEKFLKDHDAEEIEDTNWLRDLAPRGRQSVEGRASQVSHEVSMDGWATAQAIEFMKQRSSSGQPFIAHVSMYRPHQCYTPAQQFWDLYPFEDLQIPPNCDWEHKLKAPNLVRTAEHFRKANWLHYEPKTFEAGRLRKLRGYLGNISHVDHCVGQVLDWLDSAGIADDTIVVYTSDHGDYACEFDLMEKAPGICGDAITRVPFIWRAPGVTKAGHVSDALVENVDISQTLCALAGLDALQTSDGHDISSLLRGEAASYRRVAVCEHPWSKAVYQGKWRMVWYPRDRFPNDYPDGFGELYDLEADPWEMNNLYFDAQHASVVRHLKDELMDWLVTTTRPVSAIEVNAFGGKEIEVDAQTTKQYRVLVNGDRKVNPKHVRQAAADGRDNYI